MAAFTIDIKGQLNNMRLGVSKTLWPLFEAIVNAIHSIEDSPNKDNGKISITVIRDDAPTLPNFQPDLEKINSFVIEDNGVGFNKENYISFNTAYSTFKIRIGCKGIGRFLWLKAFDSVSIESTFQENGQFFTRNFSFTTDGVSPEDNLTLASRNETHTAVWLNNYLKDYKGFCPVELDSIAKKIIEHCLLYFASSKCPQIVLQDNKSHLINLNEYFDKTIKDSLHQDKFFIKDEEFTIFHMRVPGGINTHQLSLCANMQEVETVELKKHIPNLQKKIKTNDETVEDFFYVGYISGQYLDSIVNSTRTSFEYDEKGNQMSMYGTGRETIITTALEYVKFYLSDYIDNIDKQKRREIDNYAESHPQYRYLLNIKPEVYDSIPAGLSNENLELAFHKEVQKWETEIKEKGIQLENNTFIDNKTYDLLYEEYWANVTELSKTCLAEYVTRRKTLLKMLEDALTIQDSGKFKKESVIHSIICPMQHTSNDVSFEEMNLWVVDERMAYHRYLASDKTLKSMPVIDSNSTKEPDIAIFDQAFAYSDNDEPFSSITIIEFKKPDNDAKNPWDQVGQYIDLIRSGSKKKSNGQSLIVNDGTVFRCYVICDLTAKMKTHCVNAGLLETADNLGYAGFNAGRHAYCEAISYQKLISDAKKRNEILFDKLFNPKLENIKHFPEGN